MISNKAWVQRIQHLSVANNSNIRGAISLSHCITSQNRKDIYGRNAVHEAQFESESIFSP